MAVRLGPLCRWTHPLTPISQWLRCPQYQPVSVVPAFTYVKQGRHHVKKKQKFYFQENEQQTFADCDDIPHSYTNFYLLLENDKTGKFLHFAVFQLNPEAVELHKWCKILWE